MTKGNYKIPFDTKGNLLHWASPNGNLAQWEDNYEFRATLTLDKIKTGYSAKYTIWHDEHGVEFSMFVKDLLGVIENGTDIERGKVTGLWTFQKRGQNFGVRLIE